MTVAYKDPDSYTILGTDDNQYTMSDFSTIVVIEENKIREGKGLSPIGGIFIWEKKVKINDTFTCDFGVAPLGNYVLSNCVKINS